MNTSTFRFARREDAPAITALIADLMPYLTLQPDGEGAETFKSRMTLSAIGGYLTAPNSRYQMAFIGDELAGVVAVRDQTHLFHMFVARSRHRQGIARRLWDAAREDAVAAGNTSGFSVNSSAYAVPVYQRLGFVATGPRVEKDGIAYLPMRLTLATDVT